jgi:hypothetical protein
MMRKNEMHLVIEKNIPIPGYVAGTNRSKSQLRVVMETMEIGDSFLSPKTMRQTQGIISGLRRETNLRFAARTIDGQVRVWRIK